MFCWQLKGNKEKKIANYMFDVQFSWSFLTTGLYTGLCSPSSSYPMYINDIIYSEPQQQTPLKSLCFRWSKLRINFSPALANPLVQQRLPITWSCKVDFYMIWQRTPFALVHSKMFKPPIFANGWNSLAEMQQFPPPCKGKYLWHLHPAEQWWQILTMQKQMSFPSQAISHSPKPEDKPTWM